MSLDLRVIDSASKAGGVPAAIKWAVGGTGQGYVEKDENGRWQLFTTGPGTVTVTVKVLGSNGTATSGKVSLEVEDD